MPAIDREKLLNQAIEDGDKFIRKHIVYNERGNSDFFLGGMYHYVTATFYAIYELLKGGTLGQEDFRMTPILFGPSATKILERDSQLRARMVEIWVDKPTGAAATIRIGTGSSVNANGGGFQIDTAHRNDIGIIPGRIELYAYSTVSIPGYIIEHF